MNEFRFSFNKYNFLIFGCLLLPKNVAFARKIMVLPESGGLQPPARTPMCKTYNIQMDYTFK